LTQALRKAGFNSALDVNAGANHSADH
jgi:hypothetical protein